MWISRVFEFMTFDQQPNKSTKYSLYKAKFNVFWGKAAFVYHVGKLSQFSQTNVVSDSHQCQSLNLHFDKRTSDSDSIKVWALWLSLFAMLSYLG